MRTVLLALLLALLTHSCTPQSSKPVDSLANPEELALRYLRGGDHAAAAGEYLRLAEIDPQRSEAWRLRAADVYLSGGDSRAAAAVLGEMDTTTLDRVSVLRYNLLKSGLALQEHNPAESLKLLRDIDITELSDTDLIAYHETRARAYEMRGRMTSAARERIALQELLPGNRRDDNKRQLWTDLNHLDLEQLAQFRSRTSGVLQGWVELASLNQATFFQPELLRRELETWIQQYPQHPAIPVITRSLLDTSRQAGLRPGHIALCLPFSGQYQAVAEAIRDGFLAAWYADENYRPQISIYHADALNITSVYREAVAAGVDFIVGPLERLAIARLYELPDLSVPVLALNNYPVPEHLAEIPATGAGMPVLVQFALLPEDEARQIAVRAAADGNRRALAITQDNEFGDRLFKAFYEQWTETGGLVLNHIRYPQNTADFNNPVKQLLNISSSDRRAELLRQRLNRRLISDSRIRGDADMIFMAARPEDARQMVPQLRYYRAEHIPVYTSSHVYSGRTNPQLDDDLNGVLFTDMPWVLQQSQEATPLQQAVDRNWKADQSVTNRFYAFGIDAFHLIPHLGRLTMQSTVPYPGYTGDLYLERGTIHRRLSWAKFMDGEPRGQQTEALP